MEPFARFARKHGVHRTKPVQHSSSVVSSNVSDNSSEDSNEESDDISEYLSSNDINMIDKVISLVS